MTTPQLLATHLLHASPTQELLLELRTKLDNPETTSLLVVSMLSTLRSSNTPLESVGVVMEHMEALAESDAEIACCLMAHLWVAASQIDGAFDVADAIDLWIANTRSPLVEVQLRYLAEFAVNGDVLEHFRNLIKM